MKNARARTAAMSVLVAIVAAGSWVAPAGAASDGAPRIAPPVSSAYGKTLTEWLTTYWQWSLSTAQDLNQSTVGHVQLMPLPSEDFLGGTGTSDDPYVLVGELAIAIRPGTPLVLPLLTLYGERYNDGTPDDNPASFTGTTMSATLTIDGRTVLSPANDSAFTVPTTFFQPAVVYPEPTGYNSVAAIWFQGVGIVSPPLPVGVHVIHFDGTLDVPGYFVETFDNTWTVTVSPH
jgi:hypothetical protein